MEDNFEPRESSIEQEGVETQSRVQSELDKKRKIAVIALLFLAFFMMVFWFLGLEKRINDPFTYKGGEEEQPLEENLSLKDTDGDGLSDSDEINIYGTSPYLEDSDSDGFSDYEEVSSGNNPNCMAGGDCVESEIDNPDAEGEVSLGNLSLDNLSSEGVSLSNEEIDSLKKILIESGYDEETINNLSDDELYQGYLYLLNQAGTTQENPQTENNSSVNDASAIREAFIEAGYDKTSLDQISDEELIKLYNEALSEYDAK